MTLPHEEIQILCPCEEIHIEEASTSAEKRLKWKKMQFIKESSRSWKPRDPYMVRLQNESVCHSIAPNTKGSYYQQLEAQCDLFACSCLDLKAPHENRQMSKPAVPCEHKADL